MYLQLSESREFINLCLLLGLNVSGSLIQVSEGEKEEFRRKTYACVYIRVCMRVREKRTRRKIDFTNNSSSPPKLRDS